MNQHIQRIPFIVIKLTVAGMLCSLAATHAHAQDSSITLYGLFDTFVEMTNAGQGVTTRMASSGLYASRIGLRGSEDIGGGNRVNFTLEDGINTNNGTAADPTAAFNRQAWVGMSGNWGELRIGRQNTPQFYDDQAKLLGISRSSVYYLPRLVSDADLALMRRIDEWYLEHPFAGACMLVRMLRREGFFIGRKRATA